MDNQGKSGNKIFVVISVVLFLISSFLGYKLYNVSSQKETIYVEKVKVETDFASVKSDFEEIKKAYDELNTDNKQLQSELDAKKEELEDLGIQLEKYKGDAAMVKKLKRELDTIRGLIKSYLHDIDSLQQANIGLQNENKQVKSDLKTEKGKNEQLSNEKNTLSQKANENRAYRANPNASPGTKATLARSRTTSASSSVVVDMTPHKLRFNKPEKSGKQ